MTTTSAPLSHALPAPIFGLLAEFESAEELLEASKRVAAAGFAKTDAFAPFPLEGLASSLGAPPTRMPLVFLIGGIVGGLGGFALQYWGAGLLYPLNVGGRPLNSWPAFIPITFELTILGAAMCGAIAMIVRNKLPEPYHPLFNVPRFGAASRDGFFIVIEASDPHFELAATTDFLKSIGAIATFEVPK